MKYNKGLYLALIPLLLIFGGLSSTADNESDKVQCFDDEFSSMAPNERDIVQWMTINESSQAPEDMLPETKATPGFNFFMGLAAFATLSACMIARNYLKVAR